MNLRPPPLKLNLNYNEKRPTSKLEDYTLSESTSVVVDGKELHLEFSDLEYVKKLGSGNFASVHRMRVRRDDKVYEFAVKEIRLIGSEMHERRIHQESEFGLRMSACPFAVITYGIMKQNNLVRILMEVMDDTVTHLCFMKEVLHYGMSEEHIAFITKCVVKGLEFLRRECIQHRDVKPTNMLINRSGCVKICDYGVAQKMEGDVTKTNVGTYKFLAPERLVEVTSNNGFGIQSDVWSLGISVYNIVTSSLPFPENVTIFAYHNYIVNNADVKLPNEKPYSPELRTFVSSCLKVDAACRPDYKTLLQSAFLKNIKISKHQTQFAKYVSEIIDAYKRKPP